MNNKGFIATSLIYSFFLIFITLFLSVIADYLQNKGLISFIEKEIKDNINSTKSIEDFDVGDIININKGGCPLTSTGDIYTIPDCTGWIVAGISFDNKFTTDDESELILYKLTPDLDATNILDGNHVTTSTIKNDLNLTGDYNNTRVNELIMNVDSDYLLPSSTGNINIFKTCSEVSINNIEESEEITITNNGLCSPDPTKYRERKIINEWNNKKVKVLPDEMGGFTITGEAC